MSLFVCEECGCIENTALAPRFWSRKVDGGDPRSLCSVCDPEGPQEWHGRFDRRQYDGTQTVEYIDGERIDGK